MALLTVPGGEVSPQPIVCVKCMYVCMYYRIKSKSPTAEPLSSVRLEAPITGQDKVLCIGLNYKDHCEEQNLKPPEVPMIFSKFSSVVIGPNDAVKLRTDVTKVFIHNHHNIV
jgi:2-keto-4-pentenoate hydratase/2-oxohepta-3-ene-1,7-dioic acid hydratase in catechol pathway